MASSIERIVNRNPTKPSIPAALWLPTLLMSLLFALVAVMYLIRPIAGNEWIWWLYLAVAFLFPFAAWGARISWIEVGPERIMVRRPSRSQVIPMENVVEVEAHRHWRSFFEKESPPAYWLSIRRASGWPWRLYYIEPDAGDRLLAAIYRNHKPIRVFTWT